MVSVKKVPFRGEPAVFQETAGSIRYSQANLPSIVARAYGISPFYILGVDMLGSGIDVYDLAATFSEGSSDQLPAMLRKMLAERFRLVVHRETKDSEALALVVDKGGIRLQHSAADPAGTSDVTQHPPMVNRNRQIHWQEKKATLGRLAEILDFRLYKMLNKHVLDMTGVEGEFDITLDAQLPVLEATLTPGDTHDTVPSLASALGKMGLKLERRRVPVEFLVVNKVTKQPTDN